MLVFLGFNLFISYLYYLEGQMKASLKNSVLYFLSWLIIASTISFSLDFHYCGEELIDYGVFHHAQSCGMELEEPDNSISCPLVNKDCCNNHTLSFDGQNVCEQSTTIIDDFSSHNFILNEVYEYIISIISDSLVVQTFTYNSPKLVSSLYLINECFII